jgi:hypothetical protein
MFTNCTGDDAFGPVIQGCRDEFDFTMRFERIMFSIVPSSAFLTVSLIRIAIVIRRGTGSLTKSPVLLAAKLVR